MLIEDYTVKIAHEVEYRGDGSVQKIVEELDPFLAKLEGEDYLE